MGKSKDQYMEIAKVSMQKQFYDSLPKEIRDGMDLNSIAVDDFPYKEDVFWRELNKIAAKAYAKKKDHEYNLRNGIVKFTK